MKYLTALSFILIIAFTTVLNAQEQQLPLGNNPTIREYLQKHSYANQRVSQVADTLILPFEDDFSRQGIYPTESLWLDSNVFINSNYSVLPFTIGLATFDGIDKNGAPYNQQATQSDIADYLTSKPIDLSSFAGDTSIWLTFFYQPQGLGDQPETNDSLVLQFKDTGQVWTNIWAIPGRADTAFQKVSIHLTDNKYFFNAFQFRFYNRATINGNRDHWNVDYVRLKQFSGPNDLIFDNAMLHPQISLLTEYTSMPYHHYKLLPSGQQAAMISTVNDSIYQIDYSNTTYTPHVSITDQMGSTIIFNASGAIPSIGTQSITPYSISLNSFAYPILSLDSTEFLIKSYFENAGTESNAHNDTSYLIQNFHNYYSYDDGSAESAYGVTGNTDVQIAYQFDAKIQDTLRGVQIYFNPVGTDVRNKLFQIAYWDQIDVAANTSHLVYKRINQKPGDPDSINGFHTYIFDSLLVVGPGTFYIGFIQNEPQTLYGVGLDRNTDKHDKLKYHMEGFWYDSQINGSVMIRPFFGEEVVLVSVAENQIENFEFEIFPNPSNEKIFVQFNNQSAKNFQCRFYSMEGRLVKEEILNSQRTIDIKNLVPGIYFVRLEGEDNFSVVKKLIVQ